MFFDVFYVVWVPRAARPKKYQKYHPRASPEPSGDPPREPEIDQLCASGGARRPTNNLFWLPGPPPGAIWSLPGGRLGPTWRPEAPRRAPGLHFRPSGASLGSIFLRFSCFFRMVFFMFYCAVWFAWSSSCSSSRPSFRSLQVKNIKVESPGSLRFVGKGSWPPPRSCSTGGHMCPCGGTSCKYSKAEA